MFCNEVKHMRLLMGNYEEKNGIWQMELDMEGKKVLSSGPAAQVRRVSYLAVSGDLIYGVSEIPLAEGAVGGLVCYRMGETGLEPVDTMMHLPPLLSHLCVNRSRTMVYTASYGTGEILAIALNEDGSFGNIVTYTRSAGASVNPRRQTCAHPHSVWLDGEQKHLFLCDLGTDAVLSWPVLENGGLDIAGMQTAKVPAGYGPRHMAFFTDGTLAYTLCEMKYHLLVWKVDGGTLQLLQDISLEDDIPENQQGGGAIRLTPDGRQLIVTNRSLDYSRMDVLSLENPEAPRHVQTLKDCMWVRDFCLTQDGQFLLCGNQTEDSVGIFKKDAQGCYRFSWKVENIPTPVMLMIVE